MAWRRPNARRVVSRALGVLSWLGLMWATSCARPERAPSGSSLAPARGELVVIELSAGEFVEARVLSSDKGRVRVQRADGESALSLPIADVYTLPSRTLVAPQALAICGQPAGHWLGCRVEHVLSGSVQATSAEGQPLEVEPGRVLSPSTFSAANIQRRFEKRAEFEGYAQQAANAGVPPHDASFHPARRERVVARIGEDWFTAYVVENDDDAVVVSLSERSRREKVPLGSVIAEPPYPLDLHRGQFVLVRPSTQSEPWARRMVRSYNGGELRLVDAQGTSFAASPREVIPLIAF